MPRIKPKTKEKKEIVIEVTKIVNRVVKLDKPSWVDSVLWDSLDNEGKLNLVNGKR